MGLNKKQIGTQRLFVKMKSSLNILHRSKLAKIMCPTI